MTQEHDCLICVAENDGNGPRGTATHEVHYLTWDGALQISKKCARHAYRMLQMLERTGREAEVKKINSGSE